MLYSLKSTQQNNNTEVLPELVTKKIVNFLDTKTAVNLSMTCKYYNSIIQPILRRKIYQQKVPDNYRFYSIKNYDAFIAPVLENIDNNIKIKIDEFLQHNKNLPNLNKIFPEFVFQQLQYIATKIPKSIEWSDSTLLVNQEEQISIFVFNHKSNHYATISKLSPNLINIGEFSYPITRKIVDTIFIEDNQNIHKIKFTPQNNLLVCTRSDFYKINLTVFQLNLKDNNTQKIKQLWNYSINDMGDLDKVIIFPRSDDKKLFITVHNDRKIYKLKVNGIHKKLKEFIIPYDKQNHDDLNINHLVLSNNELELAVITCYLHLFSRTNNKDKFIEKSLTNIVTKIDAKDFICTKKVQFNTLGDMCLVIDKEYRVSVLIKNSGEWQLAVHLSTSGYNYVILPLDEKNIFFTDTMELKVMAIKNIISRTTPYIFKNIKEINKKSKNMISKEMYGYSEISKFFMHSSSLALFETVENYINNTYIVNIIVPRKQVTIVENFNLLRAQMFSNLRNIIN
jgi:hypothetical protein